MGQRLIDANALKEKARWMQETDGNGNPCEIKAVSVIAINDTPTVDAVEVVRCEKCKHNVANMGHDPLDATDYTDVVCAYWMSDGNRANDFCSYGERKVDNESN